MEPNTYSPAAKYYAEFGEPMPQHGYCQNTRCSDVAVLSPSGLCPECEQARLEDEQVETVDAIMVSDCCEAGVSWERYDFGTCRETGYHDAGERITCLACGKETDQILMVIRPAAPQPEEVEEHLRKPVKMQGELFNQQGVA